MFIGPLGALLAPGFCERQTVIAAVLCFDSYLTSSGPGEKFASPCSNARIRVATLWSVNTDTGDPPPASRRLGLQKVTLSTSLSANTPVEEAQKS